MTYTWSVAPLQALPLRPLGLLDLAAEAGLDAVGLRGTRLTPDEPFVEIVADPVVRQAIRDHPVAVHDLEVAKLDPATEPADLLPLLRTAAELGARSVVTQLPDADVDRRTRRFGELCDLAGPLGLRCEIEFLPWTATAGLAEAAAVMAATGRSNGGILVDLIHLHRSGGTVERLRELPASWFRLLHLNDAPAQAPADDAGLVRAARHERLLPGDGAIDIAGVLAALPDDLTIAVEVPNDEGVRRLGVHGWAAHALERSRAWVEQTRAVPGGATR
jgi:sugar phosphate isomerase/epimerase